MNLPYVHKARFKAKRTMAPVNHEEWYTSSSPRDLMTAYALFEYIERYSSSSTPCFIIVPKIDPKAMNESRKIVKRIEDKKT